MTVQGVEGGQIGRLQRTRGDAFQVELASGTTAWILRSAVFTVDNGEVTLICGSANWNQYRAEERTW